MAEIRGKRREAGPKRPMQSQKLSPRIWLALEMASEGGRSLYLNPNMIFSGYEEA